MSLPPPVTSGPSNPNYDYGYDPYNTRLHMGYDYGQGGYVSPENQAYAQQLIQYHQMYMALLQQMPANDPRRDTIMQYEAMIRDFYQQATGQPWDPMASGGGYANPYGTPGMDPNNPMGGVDAGPNAGVVPSYTDQNKLVYEDAVASYKADKKMPQNEAHFYDYGDTTLDVGNGKAVVTKEADGSIKVTVTWASDGTTKTFYFHNNKNVNVVASDPDRQITLDASVAGSDQVTTGTVGTDAESELMGDQPTKRKDDKMGYDGSSFEIYPPGNGEDYYVSARNDVFFHASSNTEFWTVEWDNAKNQYVIKVYDNAAHDGDPINTYFVDDMTNLKVSFDIDPTHIEFKGVLKGADAHTLSTTNEHAKKLSFDTTAGGGDAAEASAYVEGLATATGKTAEEVSQLILQYYPSVDKDQDGTISEEEITQAKAAGILPPVIPDSTFLHFLYDLDGQLKNILDQFAAGNASKRNMLIGPLKDRLVAVLQKFYPSVSPVTGQTVSASDDITIGSASYDFMSSALNGDQDWSNDPYSGNPWDMLNFTPGNA